MESIKTLAFLLISLARARIFTVLLGTSELMPQIDGLYAALGLQLEQPISVAVGKLFHYFRCLAWLQLLSLAELQQYGCDRRESRITPTSSIGRK